MNLRLRKILFAACFIPMVVIGAMLSIAYTLAAMYISAFEVVSVLCRRFEWWSTGVDASTYINSPWKKSLGRVWMDNMPHERH
jgi:hypothetical protein